MLFRARIVSLGYLWTGLQNGVTCSSDSDVQWIRRETVFDQFVIDH